MRDPSLLTDATIAAELARLGLLSVQTQTSERAVRGALLEAFGDDHWSALDRATVLRSLREAPAPRGNRGERRPRHAALSAGGVMECVMALGYDDATDATPARGPDAGERVRVLSDALLSRGYVEGPTAAAALLASAGRPCCQDTATTYFSRADGIALAPPAGAPVSRGVVVRLVANRDGESGGAAAAAFRDGLRHAAVCLYVGHWRYGLGADFGRALPVEVRGAPELPSDLRGLARAAKAESRRRGEPLEAVLDRWSRDGRIAVDGRDEPARVVFGDANLAPGSPTAQVVHWAARAAGNRTPADVSGLATTTAPAHRLWMLISCRTASSFPSLRRALDGSALRLVGLRGMSVLGNWRSLPWVLDALRAGGTWREVTGAIDQGLNPGGVVVDGWEHDPVIP